MSVKLHPYSAIQAETADYSDSLDDGKHAVYS